MNKLLKYTLVSLATISCLFACTKAESIESLIPGDLQTISVSSNSYYTLKNLTPSDYGTYCIYVESLSGPTRVFFGFNTTLSINSDIGSYIHSDYNFNPGIYQCLYVNTSYIFLYNNQNATANITYKLFNLDTFLDSNIPTYTSQQCQTEFNLIPISEVTPNYCALNFNMIDPAECPINSGTGAIVWSNLMINDIPYAQNQNINVFIPDFLAWNIAFNDLYTTIEVEGYNADTEYIEDVIAKENLTPTNEDFGNMLTGLVNFFPYLAIAFIMYYLVRLIYKLFK